MSAIGCGFNRSMIMTGFNRVRDRTRPIMDCHEFSFYRMFSLYWNIVGLTNNIIANREYQLYNTLYLC